MRTTSISRLLAGFIFFAPQVYATPIVTVWRINNLSQFDYATQTYETPTVPTEFDLTVTFPAEVTSATDYGQDTLTFFGEIGATAFSSPLTSYVGTDPFGLGLANQLAYAFPNVSDYPSTFFEEFAAQSNVYSPNGDQFWEYHAEIRVRRYTDSRGGAGSADYAFTTPLLMDFLADAMAHPSDYQFVFSEYWDTYNRSTNEYLAGKGWTSYNQNVALLNVSVPESTSVPEPTTLSLLGAGLFAVFVGRRRGATI